MSKTDRLKPPVSKDDLAQAKADVTEALGLLDEAIALLRRRATPLTRDMRAESPGKLRLGEAEVLAEVLDAADANPAVAAGHADDDGGIQPDHFETDLLRKWLALHQVYAQAGVEAAPRLALFASLLGDTALHHGARVRRPTLRVYRDLSALARHNATLRDQIRTALAYFGDIGRRGARTRAASGDKP